MIVCLIKYNKMKKEQIKELEIGSLKLIITVLETTVQII